MTLFRTLLRKPDNFTLPTRPARTMAVTRHFVETGDERCPLAGIWLPLNEGTALADDSERPRPVIGVLLLAGHSSNPHIASVHSLETSPTDASDTWPTHTSRALPQHCRRAASVRAAGRRARSARAATHRLSAS